MSIRTQKVRRDASRNPVAPNAEYSFDGDPAGFGSSATSEVYIQSSPASPYVLYGRPSAPILSYGAQRIAKTNTSGVTYTADEFASRVIVRSGPTAAFVDTTPTASAIIGLFAGIPLARRVGLAYELTIVNTTAFAQTFMSGSGVTFEGSNTIAANSSGSFLVLIDSTSSVKVIRL